MVKELPDTSVSTVVKLSIAAIDDPKVKNSVITFFRMRRRNLEKLIKKSEVLYNKE